MMMYSFKKGATINYKKLYINDEFISKLLEINYPDISKIIHEGKYFRAYNEKYKYMQRGKILLHTIYYENFKYFVEKINNLNERFQYNNKYKKKRLSYKYYFKKDSSPVSNETYTPLIIVIFKENKTIIEYLISNGADVNKYGEISNEDGDEFDGRDYDSDVSDSKDFHSVNIYPINCAIIRNNKDIVKYLMTMVLNLMAHFMLHYH